MSGMSITYIPHPLFWWFGHNPPEVGSYIELPMTDLLPHFPGGRLLKVMLHEHDVVTIQVMGVDNLVLEGTCQSRYKLPNKEFIEERYPGTVLVGEGGTKTAFQFRSPYGDPPLTRFEYVAKSWSQSVLNNLPPGCTKPYSPGFAATLLRMIGSV